MLALMPVLEEAGVPAGRVNVLPSRRSSVSARWCMSPGAVIFVHRID